MPTVRSQVVFQWFDNMSLEYLVKWLEYIFFLNN